MQALGAVFSASSYPCWQSAGSKKSGNELPDRVTANWRMIPGIITLVAAIIAVVCALLWECPYLCVAFAPGGLSSIYLIYMGWEFYHLKSLGESNRELRTTVGDLQVVEDNLKNENLALKENVTNLTHLKEILETKVKLHVAQLEALTLGLEGLQKVTSEGNEAFSAHLERFQKGVEDMESSLGDTKKYLKENLKEQADAIGKAAIEKLEATYREVGDFLSGEKVQEYLKQRQDLHEEISSLKSLQNKLLAKIEQYEGQVNLLKGLVEEMRGQILSLNNHDAKLTDHDIKLESLTNKLSEAAKRLSKHEKEPEDN